MDAKRALMCHFLAALAYRTQKALRDAPESFGSFRAAPQVRTPHELVWHMENVLGYALTFLTGSERREPQLPDFRAQVLRFHQTLEELGRLLGSDGPLEGISPEQLLQGPLADAMTHAGQLAMLRRLAGAPVAPENFLEAEIQTENLGPEQPLPAHPITNWPEAPRK